LFMRTFVAEHMGLNVKKDLSNFLKTVQEEFIKNYRRSPNRREAALNYVEMIKFYEHSDEYAKIMALTNASSIGQKDALQGFLNSIPGLQYNVSNVEVFEDACKKTNQALDQVGYYLWAEALMSAGKKAAGISLNNTEVRLAMAVLNRLLIEAYFVRFELKLLGKI